MSCTPLPNSSSFLKKYTRTRCALREEYQYPSGNMKRKGYMVRVQRHESGVPQLEQRYVGARRQLYCVRSSATSPVLLVDCCAVNPSCLILKLNGGLASITVYGGGDEPLSTHCHSQLSLAKAASMNPAAHRIMDAFLWIPPPTVANSWLSPRDLRYAIVEVTLEVKDD